MTEPLLSLQGVSKRYGPVAANTAIGLDVAPGSIHAILGENGAGKSTLMKLIYGVETPDEGQMRWQGKPYRPTSPADARSIGIGMVFQHFSLFETLSVTENIALIVPGKLKFFGLFGREDDFVIPWGCIRRIGNDIILVEVDLERIRVPCRKKKLF